MINTPVTLLSKKTTVGGGVEKLSQSPKDTTVFFRLFIFIYFYFLKWRSGSGNGILFFPSN